MKKKLIIVVVVLVIVGALIYTVLLGMRTDKQVDFSWELKSAQIKKIALSGAEQDVKIVVKETDHEMTSVSLSGKVSEDTEKCLENVIEKEDTLEIALVKKDQFKMMATAKGKDAITLTVSLGKNTSYEKLEVISTLGSVEAKVQPSFDGTYQLETNDQGEIKAVPDTKKTSPAQVEIDTMGDITVTK